jgi:type I restriction enzyme M protein
MYNLTKWILDNIEDYNNKIKTEEDLKVKVIVPYLEELGYEKKEIRFENAIEVNIGTRRTKVYSDIEVLINNKVEMIIDTKSPKNSLSEKDMLQSESYAKLIDTPPALYGITTNGIETIATNVYEGKRKTEIPSKSEILSELNRTKRKPLLEVERREIESVLFTLNEQDELFKVIKKCKITIEKEGLIRSDNSFREMTKILLIKMNEERRVREKEGANRFSSNYIYNICKLNDISEIEYIYSLFDEAKERFPAIYTNRDETININNNDCIISLINQLEAFSFLGTGDDIKGAVYEIFLKSTLRGDFDQYFTPREIVDFMVSFADPSIGDIVLDPACGSGGFIIQAFNYVNRKIIDSPFSEVENKKRYINLVEKCLWGQEADYDLHVLAKINLIMHGDGWNNIYQGDTLSTSYLPDEYFDLILMNPPFTIPYTNQNILGRYELGLGKISEELDILFVERSYKALKPGCDLFIVLPEGLLNIKKYKYFREWLLEKFYLLMSISLPEGAFIPFGGSVSKTCIIGLRKKDVNNTNIKPNYVFLGKANEVGYELGKKNYKKIRVNDLTEFQYFFAEVFQGIKKTLNNAECGWIRQEEVETYRLDANYMLNIIDRDHLKEKFGEIVPLKEVCTVSNISVAVGDNEETYNYLEIPDISSGTGSVTNIRRVKGFEIKNSFHKFKSGDILFSRINPRKSRVTIAPKIEGIGLVSKEVYNIKIIPNNYISYDTRYCMCAILQSDYVKSQIVRLSTGSSSSRARVQIEDFLNDVYIPIPDLQKQIEISSSTYQAFIELWNESQNFLKIFVKNQKILGSKVSKDDLRTV